MALARVLPPGCRLATRDLEIRVEASGLTTFPDVSVVCGAPQGAIHDPHARTNPTLRVKVTSRSTEAYDRGEKLAHYPQNPSLRAVVFGSHRSRELTGVARGAADPAVWEGHRAAGGERLLLRGPPIPLAVDEVSDGIALDPS